MKNLKDFVTESNRIEGILREPTNKELSITEWFLAQEVITIPTLEMFVRTVQPGAVLRDQEGLNVLIGTHRPVEGGPWVTEILGELLLLVGCKRHPYEVHHHYEKLHPFTDGNGRSGRVLWAWMMADQGLPWAWQGSSFLHTWYYQSLEDGRRAP